MNGFTSITAYVPDQASTLGLGLVAEVFGDRSHRGLPAFDVAFCTDTPGQVVTTPHAWLLNHRLARAEELLERTTLSIEEIARRVGYASAAVLREQFLKRRGVAPRDYRRTFGSLAPIGSDSAT